MVTTKTTVVDASSTVVHANICNIRLFETLHKAIARSSAFSTINNHLFDFRRRTRVLDHAARVASAAASMILHESRILDTPRGGNNTDTAVGFLHHDSEDEARVHSRRGRNLGDGSLDIGDFGG